MASNRLTQQKRILEYLEENKSISQRDGLILGIMRLSNRIVELENKGYVFKRDTVSYKTVDGRNIRYMTYSLVSQP